MPSIIFLFALASLIIGEVSCWLLLWAVVPDSAVKVIIDGLNEISPGKEAHGMVFVKDVSGAYEIGTKVIGEAALSAK